MDVPGLNEAPTGTMNEDIGFFMLTISTVSTFKRLGIHFLTFFVWDMHIGFAGEDTKMSD